MRTLIALFLVGIIYSCGTKPKAEETNLSLSDTLLPGTWSIDYHINDSTSIPVRLEISDKQVFTIVNHSERIEIDSVIMNQDSLSLIMPIFDSDFQAIITDSSSFSGVWTNHLRTDYHIPFDAKFISSEYIKEASPKSKLKYDVTFSPNNIEETTKAIGLFHDGDSYSFGTFITETGDYRFLEGSIEDNRLQLSCFDGSHLFDFHGTIKDDSIVDGKFYSGKHWYEPWTAELRNDASLRDPDSITYLVDGHQTIEFGAHNLKGDSIMFTKETYQDKVTIVQIFGSWCPNCLDENVFYKDLFEKYHNEGLEIIPVAFELGDDFSDYVNQVEKHFNDLEMPYQAFIGGKAKKSITSEKFSMVNRIISYPTSFFIDKRGEVRKIHTGFYGPGTGDYYKNYVMETKTFVEELLQEEF